MLHKNIPAADIHKIYSWTVANATARNVLSVTVNDIGRVCWELDTDDTYMLKSADPAVWIALGKVSTVPGTINAYDVAVTVPGFFNTQVGALKRFITISGTLVSIRACTSISVVSTVETHLLTNGANPLTVSIPAGQLDSGIIAVNKPLVVGDYLSLDVIGGGYDLVVVAKIQVA